MQSFHTNSARDLWMFPCFQNRSFLSVIFHQHILAGMQVFKWVVFGCMEHSASDCFDLLKFKWAEGICFIWPPINQNMHIKNLGIAFKEHRKRGYSPLTFPKVVHHIKCFPCTNNTINKQSSRRKIYFRTLWFFSLLIHNQVFPLHITSRIYK